MFHKIIVTSDSDKTLRIAKKAGAEILIKRPRKLSNDKAKSREVINHAIKYVNKLDLKFKYVCQIYPTGVLLNVQKLKKGFEILKKKNVTVFTITEYQYPIQRSLKIEKIKLK